MRPVLLALACGIALSARGSDQPVPVQKEPMHQTVFENEYVRVIDVRIPPGETSLFHIHVIPSVIVYLTQSTNRSESWPDKAILLRDVAPGQSRYAPYDEKPLTHRVTNTGTGLFRVFDIELLRKPSPTPTLPPLTSARIKPHWDEKLVRSSGIALDRNASIDLPVSPYAILVVGTSGSVHVSPSGLPGATAHTLDSGGYQFFAPHTPLKIENRGTANAEVVLLELKE